MTARRWRSAEGDTLETFHWVISAMIWTGFALVAVGMMRRASVRLARRYREQPDRIASLRFGYTQRSGGAMLLVMLGGFVVSALIGVDPGFDKVLLFAIVALLVTVSLSTSYMREADRVFRGADWNAAGMRRFEWFVLLTILGPIVVALVGATLTSWGMAMAGLVAPSWQGAVWMMAAVLLRFVVPLDGLLGTRTAMPADVVDAFVDAAGASSADELPPVYKLDTANAQVANAFAMWSLGEGSFITITDYLLERLSPQQAVGVLLHELAHHRYGHIFIYLGVVLIGQALGTAALIAGGVGQVWWAVIVYLMLHAFVLVPISRRAELACDAFAAERCGDPAAYGEALKRLHEAAVLPAHIGNQDKQQTHPGLMARLKAIGVEPEQQESERLRSQGPRKVKIGKLAWVLGVSLAAAVFGVGSLIRGGDPGIVTFVVSGVVLLLAPGLIQMRLARGSAEHEFEPVELDTKYDPRKGGLQHFVVGWLLILLAVLLGVLMVATSNANGELGDARMTTFAWGLVAVCIFAGAALIFNYIQARRADEEIEGVVRPRRPLWRSAVRLVIFLAGLLMAVFFGLMTLVTLALLFGVVEPRGGPLGAQAQVVQAVLAAVFIVLAGVGFAAVAWYLKTFDGPRAIEQAESGLSDEGSPVTVSHESSE